MFIFYIIYVHKDNKFAYRSVDIKELVYHFNNISLVYNQCQDLTWGSFLRSLRRFFTKRNTDISNRLKYIIFLYMLTLI